MQEDYREIGLIKHLGIKSTLPLIWKRNCWRGSVFYREQFAVNRRARAVIYLWIVLTRLGFLQFVMHMIDNTARDLFFCIHSCILYLSLDLRWINAPRSLIRDTSWFCQKVFSSYFMTLYLNAYERWLI